MFILKPSPLIKQMSSDELVTLIETSRDAGLNSQAVRELAERSKAAREAFDLPVKESAILVEEKDETHQPLSSMIGMSITQMAEMERIRRGAAALKKIDSAIHHQREKIEEPLDNESNIREQAVIAEILATAIQLRSDEKEESLDVEAYKKASRHFLAVLGGLEASTFSKEIIQVLVNQNLITLEMYNHLLKVSTETDIEEANKQDTT